MRRGRSVVEVCLERHGGATGALEALEILERVLALHLESRGNDMQAMAKGVMYCWSESVRELEAGLRRLPPDGLLPDKYRRLLVQAEKSARTVFDLDWLPTRFTVLIDAVFKEKRLEAQHSERHAVEPTAPFVVDEEGELKVPGLRSPEWLAMHVQNMRLAEGAIDFV